MYGALSATFQSALAGAGNMPAAAGAPGLMGMPAEILAQLQGGAQQGGTVSSQGQYQTQQVQPLMTPSTSTQQTPTGVQSQQTNSPSDLSQYSRDQLLYWANKYRMGGPEYSEHVINSVSHEMQRRQYAGQQ